MLNCNNCETSPDFVRKPVFDNCFITAAKVATCRECGSSFPFHLGQIPSERSMKELIYDECDHKITTVQNLKNLFFGESYAIYYNMMIYLKYGNNELHTNGAPIVLTVHQPFASQLAAGIRKIEIRPRKVNYRGTVLIHASKNPPVYSRPKHDLDYPNGAIIGAFELYHCAKIVHPDIAKTYKTELEAGFIMVQQDKDWIVNHFAWLGYDHRLLQEPIPYSNGQGYGLRLREEHDFSTFKFIT